MPHLVAHSKITGDRCLTEITRLPSLFGEIWQERHSKRVLIRVQTKPPYYLAIDFRSSEEIVISLELTSHPPSHEHVCEMIHSLFKWIAQLEPESIIKHHTLKLSKDIRQNISL